PAIELDGELAGSGTNGLTITTGGNLIEGLVINRFQGAGIVLRGTGATNNVIAGNYIGTDVTGTLDLGNALDGIRIEQGASNNIIGSSDTLTDTSAVNLISANGGNGILLTDAGTSGNIVGGNLLGTDVNGVANAATSFGAGSRGRKPGNAFGGSGT